MKIDFPIVQNHHAMLIRVPMLWEDFATDIIEECLRECGLQLDENANVVYLVQTPEPWTKDELDYMRKKAEQKLMKM